MKMIRGSRGAIATLLCAGFSCARAFQISGISISGEEALLVQRGDETVFDGGAPADQSKEVLENRLTVELRWLDWTLGGRFDHLDPSFFGAGYTGLRKRYLEFEDGTNHLRIGSFDTLLGQGLALNLYEDPLINVDRQLDGFLLERRTASYSVHLLGGLGSFLAFEFPEEHREDRVAAGYGTYRWLDRIELGQGYVETRDGVPGDSRHINRKHLATLRLDLEQGSFYGELAHNWVRVPGEDPAEEAPGRGGYAKLSGWFGDFSLTGEYKNYALDEQASSSAYSGVGIPWSEPPSLRPLASLTTLNRKQFLVDKNNEVGFAVEGDYSAPFGGTFSLFYLNTAERSYFDPTPGGEEVVAAWPKWVRFDGISGSLTSNFEELTFGADLPIREGLGTYWVADLSIDGHIGAPKKQRTLGVTTEAEIGDVHGLTVSLEYQHTEDRRFEEIYAADFPELRPPRFHDGVATITYSRSPWFSVFVNHERTNEAKHWEAVGYKGAEEPLEDSYWIAGLDLDITHSTRLGLQAGSERGGVVCRGGTCKFIQPFRGWRMDLVHRF